MAIVHSLKLFGIEKKVLLRGEVSNCEIGGKDSKLIDRRTENPGEDWLSDAKSECSFQSSAWSL